MPQLNDMMRPGPLHHRPDPPPRPANHEPTDYFWTDFEQAYQRLYGTVVNYEDRPVYIVQVDRGDDRTPRCHTVELGKNFRENRPQQRMLNEPGFKRFRNLPKLGWMNLLGREDHPPMALYLKRRPVQGTQHGLCSRNVQVLDAHGRGSGMDFTHIIGDDGFLHSQTEDYPPVDFILESLPRGGAAGVSLDYAITVDASLGIRYLLRREEKVGLFAGDEIRLPENMIFLRDEIQSTPAFNGRVVVQL